MRAVKKQKCQVALVVLCAAEDSGMASNMIAVVHKQGPDFEHESAGCTLNLRFHG